METAQLEAMVKALKDKGYSVELEPVPNDDEVIKTLKEHGYNIIPPKTETDTETKPNENKDIIEAMKAYGFEPIKETKDETEDDKESETKSETKSSTKTETETDKETSNNDVKKQVMFMLGNPSQNGDGKNVINEETISVMTPEEIQENMPEIRKYILDNGGQF